MISQTVEYALRAIVTIAQADGQPCTARKISEVTQVPSAYLSKLIVSTGASPSQFSGSCAKAAFAHNPSVMAAIIPRECLFIFLILERPRGTDFVIVGHEEFSRRQSF